MKVNIDKSWQDIVDNELTKSYMLELLEFLSKEEKKYTIYPQQDDIFAAFRITSFEKLKVVIVGQDPYHGFNQAHGLAFSVNEGVAIPPSLINIFKELEDDMGCKKPKSGSLISWANQGVFLINSVLTVREGQPNSHKGKGWEIFVENIIKHINEKKKNVVFILWGKPAQQKEKLIDTKRHLVLKSPHPSPLSSYRGFFGSKPFSKTDNYFIQNGISVIKWCI